METHESMKTGIIPLILGFISAFFGDMENLNLTLEIIVKCCSLISFCVFMYLNYPRIKKRFYENK